MNCWTISTLKFSGALCPGGIKHICVRVCSFYDISMVPEKIAVNVVCCRNLTPQMVCHLLRHMC